MRREYHILNGDALKERFPSTISGEIIIARECLVDGNINARNLEEFFALRAEYISQLDTAYAPGDYYRDTVSEFERIKNIPTQSIINLWFEDDLFCQVNLWFVCSLLHNYTRECQVFLVRPASHDQYGFGGLDQAQLNKVYDERVELKALDQLAVLWDYYQRNDLKNLTDCAAALKETYPFILPVVEAHKARIPTKDSKGKPVEVLKEIMQELATTEFGPVFREFSKRLPIYGFGDLQVRRLLEQIEA